MRYAKTSDSSRIKPCFTTTSQREKISHFTDACTASKTSMTRIEEVLLAVDLKDRQRDRIQKYSRGMKQRLAIARAILHHPSILLLDEPFTGLDTSAQSVLSNMITTLKAEGRTIFLVTHDLARGLALADRFGILFQGQLVHEASTKDISESELQTLYENKTTL